MIGKWNPALAPLLVALNTLRVDPGNTNDHPPESIELIRTSLKTYGQQKPIVVRAGVVKAGNGTLDAARALGWTHLAAVEFDQGEAHADGYAIMDNRSAELSHFNPEKLGDALMRIDSAWPGFEVQAVGFDDADLIKLLKLHAEVVPPAAYDVNPQREFVVEQAAQLTELARHATEAARLAVVVDCDSEAELVGLIERLIDEGYSCRRIS